ncbi:MAG: hypothetical protein ABJZ55_17980 [Fuerstiella sp.]
MKTARYCLPLVLLFSVTASAADPTDLLHKDAAVVVRLKAPDTTVKDLAAFIDKVQPGFGAIVQGQASTLGLAINNPTLAGVDLSRDWYFMLFASAEAAPQPVLLIPTNDVQAFKDALGPRFAVAVKDDWIAYSPESRLLEAVQDGFDSSTDSLSAVQSDSLLEDLGKGHLSVLINSPALQSTFVSQLANAEQSLEQGLDQLEAIVQQSGQQMPAGIIQTVYGRVGQKLIQAARDSKGAVIRLEANDVELRIEERFVFAENSITQKALARHTVSDLAPLTALPQDLPFYFAGQFEIDELLEWSEEVMGLVVADPESNKAFQKSLAAMKSIDFGVVAGAIDLSTASDAALSYLATAEVSPTTKLRDAFAEMGSSMKYEVAGITQSMKYTRNAESLGGKEVDLYEFKQEIPPQMDPTGMQKAMNQRLYGGDTITQRMIFEDDRLLQLLGGTIEDLQPLLNPVAWTDTNLLDARKRLYPTANLVMIADVPDLMLSSTILLAESPMVPLPLSVEQLTQLIIQPSYAGTSISLKNGELNARTNLPAEMFQQITRGVFMVQAMLNGQ